MCSVCKDVFENGRIIKAPSVEGGGMYSSERTNNMGNHAEQLFQQLCEFHNFKLRPATKYENMKLHYDFVVKKHDGQYTRVEVKSMKARRRGEAPDPSIIYIETKNVMGGPGWIYGEADDIAFEQPWGFFVVPKIELLHYVNSIYNNLRVSNVSGVLYTRYSRIDRDDEVIIVPITDIHKLHGIKKLCIQKQV